MKLALEGMEARLAEERMRHSDVLASMVVRLEAEQLQARRPSSAQIAPDPPQITAELSIPCIRSSLRYLTFCSTSHSRTFYPPLDLTLRSI